MTGVIFMISKKGEKIFIDSSDIAKNFIKELCKQIKLKKAVPVLVSTYLSEVNL